MRDPTGHDPHDDNGHSMNDDCSYDGVLCHQLPAPPESASFNWNPNSFGSDISNAAMRQAMREREAQRQAKEMANSQMGTAMALVGMGAVLFPPIAALLVIASKSAATGAGVAAAGQGFNNIAQGKDVFDPNNYDTADIASAGLGNIVSNAVFGPLKFMPTALRVISTGAISGGVTTATNCALGSSCTSKSLVTNVIGGMGSPIMGVANEAKNILKSPLVTDLAGNALGWGFAQTANAAFNLNDYMKPKF